MNSTTAWKHLEATQKTISEKKTLLQTLRRENADLVTKQAVNLEEWAFMRNKNENLKKEEKSDINVTALFGRWLGSRLRG